MIPMFFKSHAFPPDGELFYKDMTLRILVHPIEQYQTASLKVTMVRVFNHKNQQILQTNT